MISGRMSRPSKLLATSCVILAVAGLASACGSQNIKVAKSSGPVYSGAVLFNQRCAGCHTFSYAATEGSAANVRTKQFNNGPNFDIRCERPVTRVLYAIQNGGFSGAIMPQNVVVGQDAINVAKFVATYSGRKAPRVPGTIVCDQQPIGTIPALVSAASTSPSTSTTTTPASTSTTVAKKGKPAAAPAKAAAKKKK
jgi:mono/diheme cytochrome c family protein